MRGEVFAKLFDHHRFVIGPIADVHFGNGVAVEDDEVGADAVEGLVVVMINQLFDTSLDQPFV